MRTLAIVMCLFFSLTTRALPFQSSEMVWVAANSNAVQAAQKIADAGGNVVDVAVTLALTLAVTNPQIAALGGGGFALVRFGKATEFLDFRERAPQAAHPDLFQGKNAEASITGGLAVAVPGLPAGLWELHKRFGKIHWSRLLDAPIQLAEKGFRISGDLAADIKTNHQRLDIAAKQILLTSTLQPPEPGFILVQKKLASALKDMRNRNVTSFYSGVIARDIVDTVRASGGIITLKDLADYKVVWRKPLKYEYKNHHLYLAPPPSSGGIIIQMALALTEKIDLLKSMDRSADEYHLLGQVFNRAFRSRGLIADPDFSSVESQKILSPENIQWLAQSIKKDEATSLPLKDEPLAPTNHEKPETTHLSVIDKYGNAVSMTLTLNGNFGSGLASPKYGIFLNNEMDDFTTTSAPNMFGLVQGSENKIAPGKRPLSSMSPTLVEKDGQIVMSLGAPGGPRIISSVAQVLYRTLGRGDALEVAIEAPRVHQQHIPNKLFIDAHRFAPETLEIIERRKNVIEKSWQGSVYGVRNVGGVLEAVADTRNEGATGGK